MKKKKVENDTNPAEVLSGIAHYANVAREIIDDNELPERKADYKAALKSLFAEVAELKELPVPNPPKKPKSTAIPLDELTVEQFEAMSEEEVYETYAKDIKEHGEWIWREQDRGGPTYDLESCIEQAKKELMEGYWGPLSE